MSKTQRYINVKVNYFPYEKCGRVIRRMGAYDFEIKDGLFHAPSYNTTVVIRRKIETAINERNAI